MKCALIVSTGDRVDYLKQCVDSCKKLIKTYKDDIEIDIFFITFEDAEINYDEPYTHFKYQRPSIEILDSFPKSIQQVQNYSNDLEQTRRITYGHYVLYGGIPNTIFENINIFKQYDLILKSRADLVFDIDYTKVKNFNPESQIITFECFWGGCRYNPNFTNDSIIFGKTEDVLRISAFKMENCLLNRFWNPEQYTTYLYTLVPKTKVEMTTDKYFFLSKDRKSRKFIGFPLEKINKTDISFLENLGVNTSNLDFENQIEL